MKFKLTGLVSLILLVLLAGFGCRQETEFGRLAVCSEIDSQTYQPLVLADEFDLNATQIFASIEVIEVPASHYWYFRWIDETGQELASASGQYMENSNHYVSGYFASSLRAGDDTIIAPPGSYQVEFLHNKELVDRAEFTISEPKMVITDAFVSSTASEGKDPETVFDDFYNTQDIYLYLDFNYLVKDSSLQVKWFRQEQILAQSEWTVAEDQWSPGGKVFMLQAEKGLVPGIYRAEVYMGQVLDRSLDFRVVNDMETIQTYGNDDYNFSLEHPQWLQVVEQEGEQYYQVFFSPRDGVQDLQLGVWIMDKDKAPSQGDWEAFSRQLAAEKVDQLEGMELVDSQDVDDGFAYTYQGQDDSRWELRMNFRDQDDLFFIFSGVAEEYYRDDMRQIYRKMLDSFKLSIE